MEKEERIYRQSETSEKSFERRLVNHCKLLGCIPVKMTDPMNAGLPDRMIIMPGGKVVWVEIKSSGKKPSRLQQKRFDEMLKMEHPVYVVGCKGDLELVMGYIKYFSGR